jgi:uncharacterized protein YkwD
MRKTCLGGGAAFVLALTAISGTAAAATTCAGAELTPTRENLAQVRAAVTCLVNVERVKRGLPALRTAAVLRDSAARHSADMVRRGYFSHITPTGVSVRARLARAGVHPKSVGENIAWGMGDDDNALTIVAGWMHSPIHRANILSRRFTRTGIGIALGSPGHPGGAGTATFTQVFAGR